MDELAATANIDAVVFQLDHLGDARARDVIELTACPILRFNNVPDVVEVHLLDRAGQPFLGAGEAGQGPAAAALANTVANATGRGSETRL